MPAGKSRQKPVGDAQEPVQAAAMSKDIEPYITVATALQATAEALSTLEKCLPDADRKRFAATVLRLRTARVELSNWVEENRG